jgi:hypothetical protein
MKLTHKLTFGFLAVISLIWATGYLATILNKNALEHSIGESSTLLAQETLNKIDINIYNRIEKLQGFAKYLSEKNEILSSNRKFDNIDNVQAYINEEDNAWIAVSKETITPFMQKIINNELSAEIREELYLKEFYEKEYGYKVYGEIFVTNKYGANIAQTGKTSDYYQADEKWWQAAKNDGIYISDVTYDESTDTRCMDIGVRIDDVRGNFLGVMKGVLNIKGIASILNEVKVNSESVHKITRSNEDESRDKLDLDLISKDAKRIYSTEHDGNEDISANDNDLLSNISNGTLRNYLIGPGCKLGEGETLYAHAISKGYKSYKGLGWILIIEQRTEHIFAPVNKLRNYMLSICTAVTILGALLGYFISASIKKSIRKLADATTEIGKGNLQSGDRVDREQVRISLYL